MEEKKFHNFKNKKFSSIAWIMAILVIVIAVILNMIVSQLDLGWDVSPNKQYSLGKTTTAYLDELDQNGTKIDFYVLAKMDDIKDSVDTLALYRALKEYDEHDCINLIDIDPNSDEATMEKINPDNALTLVIWCWFAVIPKSESRATPCTRPIAMTTATLFLRHSTAKTS